MVVGGLPKNSFSESSYVEINKTFKAVGGFQHSQCPCWLKSSSWSFEAEFWHKSLKQKDALPVNNE